MADSRPFIMVVQPDNAGRMLIKEILEPEFGDLLWFFNSPGLAYQCANSVQPGILVIADNEQPGPRAETINELVRLVRKLRSGDTKVICLDNTLYRKPEYSPDIVVPTPSEDHYDIILASVKNFCRAA